MFESKASLRCYPKEFIFAEKLETILYRGKENTRMKDFHDLHSLITMGNLNERVIEKAIHLVFNHRKTSLTELPIIFDLSTLEQLEKAWDLYRRRLKTTKIMTALPNSIENLIVSINHWLNAKITLC